MNKELQKKIPEHVIWVLGRLQNAGFESFIVGGCVIPRLTSHLLQFASTRVDFNLSCHQQYIVYTSLSLNKKGGRDLTNFTFVYSSV